MTQSTNKTGTGHHGHKDTEEPYPHHAGGGQERQGERQHDGRSEERREARSSEPSELKEREYRDEQGNIHHHTRTYMEQHGEEKQGSEKQGRR